MLRLSVGAVLVCMLRSSLAIMTGVLLIHAIAATAAEVPDSTWSGHLDCDSVRNDGQLSEGFTQSISDSFLIFLFRVSQQRTGDACHFVVRMFRLAPE